MKQNRESATLGQRRVGTVYEAMTTRTRADRPAVRRLDAKTKSPRRAPVADERSATVAGVRISHPARLIYPDLGISKLQLARYYEKIADWIVPHVVGRPLTLLHCPAGLAAPCS